MGIDEYSILRKKQKKNAFAATALLISIAIALLVMVGAVLILGKVNDKDRIAPRDGNSGSETRSVNNNDGSCEGLNKEMVFNDNIRNIKEAAISYFTNARLPKELNETKKITLREMKDKKLVLNVRDASANTCDGNKSYVEVTKGVNEYVMKILLSCSDIEDHIIVHLGCYDYCDKDVCEKEVEPEKAYEYEYKKITSCTMGDWSAWGAWKTTREKTSNLKKEDIKTETSSKDKISKYDAKANITYNCDKYSKDYKLSGTKCVKGETIVDTKQATKNPDTYNCDKYGKEYKLKDSQCIKDTSYQDTKQAKTVYNCNAYSSEYKLTGDKCIKPGDVQDATPKYNTISKTQTYTCYKDVCTTQIIYSCPTENSCGTKPVKTCQQVKKTCEKTVYEKHIYDYECPNGYNKSQDKDGKWICTLPADPKPAGVDYDCSIYSGYSKVGSTCVKTIPTQDIKQATKNPDTYNCDKYSGYDLVDKLCIKISGTDIKDATKKIVYTCEKGYTLTDKVCTKSTQETTKITYYRYATRTCTGGSTSIKWSTSSKDSKLISEGYKATGNKREIKVVEK